jgi:molecular chaperone GrpE
MAQATSQGNGPPVRDDDLEPIDLHTLLGQMTALRHEVHLQTRAVRTQQEQNAETLQQLGSAVESMRQTHASSQPAAGDELIRPLLKTLVDLYDSLALAEHEVGRVQAAISSSSVAPEAEAAGQAQPLLQLLDEWEGLRGRPVERRPPPAPGWLAWWFGSRRPERHSATDRADEARIVHAIRDAVAGQVQQTKGGEESLHHRRLLGSVLTGYTMSLQRVERALRQHELEPIESVGRPFDPERMEVLEVVHDSGRPTGEVVEEVRRGYLWRGRVFRYAQVRVAKS